MTATKSRCMLWRPRSRARGVLGIWPRGGPGPGEAGYDVQLSKSLNLWISSPSVGGTVVFNVIHGTYGEDGTLQKELEAAGMFYTSVLRRQPVDCAWIKQRRKRSPRPKASRFPGVSRLIPIIRKAPAIW